MKFGILNRPVALVASATLLAGGTLVAGASNAAASNQVANVFYDSNVYRGSWAWNQDPHDGQPGDAFRVTDDVADGYGIEADLRVAPMRIATTAGHSSPYTSPWASGDLTEDKSYTLDIYLVKNGHYTFVNSYTVTA